MFVKDYVNYVDYVAYVKCGHCLTFYYFQYL